MFKEKHVGKKQQYVKPNPYPLCAGEMGRDF